MKTFNMTLITASILAWCTSVTAVSAGNQAPVKVTVRDKLPVVPVPLHPPDDDVVLDLPAALSAIYDEAAYDLSIDYRQPPPPPDFSASDQAWMHTLLRTH